MEHRAKLAAVLSGIYLIAACLLLFGICGYCYPGLGARVKDAVAGTEDSPVRQAFLTLADGLEAGEPLRETVSDTLGVLFSNEAQG